MILDPYFFRGWLELTCARRTRILWPESNLACTLARGMSGPEVWLSCIPPLPKIHGSHTRMGFAQVTLKVLVPGDQYQLWRFTRIGRPKPWPAKDIEVSSESHEPGKNRTTTTSEPSTWIGTYILVNAHNSSAADLSARDNETIIGYPQHGAENQQWEFIPTGNGYAIRSVKVPNYNGQEVYMNVKGEVRETAAVVAKTHRAEWCVEQTADGGHLRHVFLKKVCLCVVIF